MKKRIIGRVLGGVVAFATVFSVMSSTVLAAVDYTLTLKVEGGVGKAYQGNTTTQASAKDYSGTLTYDAETGWTMDNFAFETTAGTAVQIKENTTFNITGNNQIIGGNASTGEAYGIRSDNGITIQGDGSLKVKAGDGRYSFGIYLSSGDLLIKGGDVEASAGNASAVNSNGVCCNSGSAIIEGGSLEAKAGTAGNNSLGIYARGGVSVAGGKGLVAEGTSGGGNVAGIYSSTDLTVNEDVFEVSGATKDDDVWKKYEKKVVVTPIQNESDNTSYSETYTSNAAPSQSIATIGGLSGNGNDVSVEVANGSATVSTISKELIEEIATSTANGSGIVLDLSKAGSSVSKVTLNKETMTNIADAIASVSNNKENLVVKTNTATVSLDSKAISAVLSKSSGDIQIVVDNKKEANLSEGQQAAVKEIASEAGKEVVQTFEAYIVCGTEKITDLNGGEVTVGKLDIKLDAAKDPKKYQVYTITENGELVLCNTWVENGAIFFKTGTLSNYVLVYDANL